MGFFSNLWNGIKKVVTAPIKLVKNLISGGGGQQQEQQVQQEVAQPRVVQQFEAIHSNRPTNYSQGGYHIYRPQMR